MRYTEIYEAARNIMPSGGLDNHFPTLQPIHSAFPSVLEGYLFLAAAGVIIAGGILISPERRKARAKAIKQRQLLTVKR